MTAQKIQQRNVVYSFDKKSCKIQQQQQKKQGSQQVRVG